MRSSRIFAALSGFLMGFFIWVAVSTLTGRREAWDGENNLMIYSACLLIAGYVLGFIFTPVWPFTSGGIYLGQLTAMIFKSGGDFGLLPLGLIALAIFTGVSVFGSYVATLHPKNRR